MLLEREQATLREWRREHPKASLSEIERALDERLMRLRARFLADVAKASPAADWTQGVAPQEHPGCQQCARPLQARGKQRRALQTHGGAQVLLERTYGVCPSCQAGVFPPG
jgi:hypothetical protein